MIKVALPTGDLGGLDDKVYPRFARSPTITIVELDNDFRAVSVRVLKNPGVEAARGAAIKVAEVLSNEGVSIVVTSSLGPHASAVLQNLGIRVINVEEGVSVKEAIEKVREILK